jgi:AcrR family transcriptional regulator
MVKKQQKTKDIPAQEKILAAAKKVFTTKGMAGARMQDIADEAGINKALLHYYFRDKDKLFEVVFVEEAQKFFPKIKSIFNSDLPLFEKIENFVNEYIDEMLENPYLPWFVMNEINRDPDRFMYKIWGKDNLPNPARFLEQIENEVAKGTIKRISPIHLMLNLLSMTIFPFVAKPMITRNLRLDELQFRQAMEQRRKERLNETIDQLRRHQAAARVKIPVPPNGFSLKLAELSAGVSLEPGHLHIEFSGTEDLLCKLYGLSQAASHDFDRFRAATEPAG